MNERKPITQPTEAQQMRFPTIRITDINLVHEIPVPPKEMRTSVFDPTETGRIPEVAGLTTTGDVTAIFDTASDLSGQDPRLAVLLLQESVHEHSPGDLKRLFPDNGYFDRYYQRDVLAGSAPAGRLKEHGGTGGQEERQQLESVGAAFVQELAVAARGAKEPLSPEDARKRHVQIAARMMSQDFARLDEGKQSAFYEHVIRGKKTGAPAVDAVMARMKDTIARVQAGEGTPQERQAITMRLRTLGRAWEARNPGESFLPSAHTVADYIEIESSEPKQS